MAATPPPLSKQEISLSRKAPDMVTTEGVWCCVARSVGGSPSLSRRAERPKSRELHKLDENHSARLVVDDHKLGENFFLKENQNRVSTEGQENNKGERRRKSGELNKGGEALKSGEIAALIKQGFLSSGSLEKSGSNSPFRIRLSPGRISPIVEHSAASPMPPPLPTSNYGKFNSLLNSGLLNPGIASSPPVDKIRSSPTLFEMMVNEQDLQPKAAQTFASQGNSLPSKQLSIQEKMLSANSPGNQFNDASSSDVKLTLSNKEGFSVTLNVHRHILVAHSRFFAAKLSDRWSKQQRSLPYVVEISDCDDIELYLETLRFMYCRDLKRKLMKESVSRVLGILKVSATIVFEAGVLSCLEYLEAVPWAEEDEEKVTSMLCQLQLQSIGAEEVLKRLSTEDPSGSEDILVRLLHLVTKGTDEKARREMKNLVSRMLRENAIQCKDPIDVSKESLYRSCHGCLDLLLHLFMQASSNDFVNRASEDRGMLVAQIARQADNLHWLVDILIDRQIADDFVKMWANQSELATLHSQIPIMFRYEVSRLTARLCIAVGKGQVLAPKEIRFMLLQNWLQPLIDDFAWMQRACKGLDRKVVEEGISQTILTLPLKQQQTIMMTWFDRFLNNGDDCPNLQRAFEVWWRRTFLRPALENEMSSREVVS